MQVFSQACDSDIGLAMDGHILTGPQGGNNAVIITVHSYA